MVESLGYGLRAAETATDPQAVRGSLSLELPGGFASIMEFKLTAVEKTTKGAIFGGASPFKFVPDPDSARKTVDVGEMRPGDLSTRPPETSVRIQGRLQLDVEEIPDQTDFLDSKERGPKYPLKQDLSFNGLNEFHPPKLETPVVSTGGMEYREGGIPVTLQGGTVISKSMLDIINRKMGEAPMELTVPLPPSFAAQPLNSLSRDLLSGIGSEGGGSSALLRAVGRAASM